MVPNTELVRVSDSSLLHPIVVDLGKQPRKHIKKLKRGSGDLMEEVAAALEQVRNSLSDADRSRPLIPVIFLYKEKRKRSKSLGFPFGL
jgi:hypothetical protein